MKRDAGIEARRWLAQAEADLSTAILLRDAGVHYAACFHSQQAAEKALKAVLFARGARRVFGHSVGELAKEVVAVVPALSGLDVLLRALDQYYVATRYPNGLPGGVPAEVFGPEDSARAVRLASSAIPAAKGVCAEAADPGEE